MTGRKPGKPTLTPEQADRVRHKIEEILPIYGSTAHLAERLGISPSGLSQIRSRKNAPSFSVAWATAALARMPFTSLLGLPPDMPSLPADPRERALRRLEGLLPAEVEARVREEADDGRPEEDWIRAALDELTLFRREASRAAAKKHQAKRG